MINEVERHLVITLRALSFTIVTNTLYKLSLHTQPYLAVLFLLRDTNTIHGTIPEVGYT